MLFFQSLNSSLSEQSDKINDIPIPSFEQTFFSNSNNNKETDSSFHSSLNEGKLSLKNILTSLSNQKATMSLQKSLQKMNTIELDDFIQELKGNFISIINDKNGNYLCSDLFKKCTVKQRIEIINELFPFIPEISISEYGTHPIQTLIELIETIEESSFFINVFSNEQNILKASLNSNGAYVIQKLIMKVPELRRVNFNFFIIKLLPVLAKDMYGVCTLKKFVFVAENLFYICSIVQQTLNHFEDIATNQYGNYLIQYIMKVWWKQKEIYLMKIYVEKYFMFLITNRYSSHIVDSYIKMISMEKKKKLFNSILLNNEMYNSLTQSKYANCVIVKLMNSVKE